MTVPKIGLPKVWAWLLLRTSELTIKQLDETPDKKIINHMQFKLLSINDKGAKFPALQ